MEDFWPQRGAISHVSIWGREDTSDPPVIIVPEPSALALAGLALLAAAAARRKSAARR
jgi:MYXO-CTERM domain-containing protein